MSFVMETELLQYKQAVEKVAKKFNLLDQVRKHLHRTPPSQKELSAAEEARREQGKLVLQGHLQSHGVPAVPASVGGSSPEVLFCRRGIFLHACIVSSFRAPVRGYGACNGVLHCDAVEPCGQRCIALPVRSGLHRRSSAAIPDRLCAARKVSLKPLRSHQRSLTRYCRSAPTAERSFCRLKPQAAPRPP